MWPVSYYHQILTLYSTSFQITWSLSAGCSLTLEVARDSCQHIVFPLFGIPHLEPAMDLLSTNLQCLGCFFFISKNSINTATYIFPPPTGAHGRYSNITINQAAVVILVLSWSGRSLREVFLLTLQFKTFYLYLFSGALGTTVLNLLLETKKTRRYTQVKICFTSKESYNLTMKYIFKTNQRWHTYV